VCAATDVRGATQRTQHLEDLGVLLALLLEGELALLVVVLVLAPAPVFTSLWSLVSMAGYGGGAEERTFPLFFGMLCGVCSCVFDLWGGKACGECVVGV
jgi:hypothetical protein